MHKYTLLIMLVISTFGCVEPYKFEVVNKTDGIVIESFISNKSYNNTLTYPSEGRYFTVKLGRISDVTNEHDEKIDGAIVTLINNNGEEWIFGEYGDVGIYELRDNNFAAMYGDKYQLNVQIPTGESFQSEWVELPNDNTELGEVSFNETTVDEYVWINEEERTLREFNGIDVFIEVPENKEKKDYFYKWNYDPLWVYTAPEAQRTSINKTCWVESPYYLNHHTILKDQNGDYSNKLFFMKTTDNKRIFEYFSVLITQTVMSEDYYYFCKDLESQNQSGGIYDQPPFNLPTNYTAINNEMSVNGYFTAVVENAIRWEFNKDQLSYWVEDNIARLCIEQNDPPGPPINPNPCKDCTATDGDAANTPPNWW